MTGPDPDDDLADRVSAVEQQQRADRHALGSLDADVSDLQDQRRQDVRLLQSLRETQIEHGERLGRLESGLDRLATMTATALGVVGERLGRLESGQTRLESRQTRLESRLGRLESGTSAGFAAVGARLDVIVELLHRPSD
jgi:chromosome segregation ATPase